MGQEVSDVMTRRAALLLRERGTQATDGGRERVLRRAAVADDKRGRPFMP